MNVATGIGLAFVAMLCWGFGDFLIQKSVRKLGDWETMFVITGFGFIVLLPFAWHSIPGLFGGSLYDLGMLLLSSVVLFGAALLDLEALKRGKLSIVEPIWSLEIVSAAFLSFVLLKEVVSVLQAVIILVLMAGLMLVAFSEKRITKAIFLEKGVIIAAVAAISMGCANFFLGWSGRLTSPVMVNFFTDAFLLAASSIFILTKGRFKSVFKDIKSGYSLILPMAVADNAAWLAYIFSMSLVPIAIATALSESYIIIAVLLGILVNKEKLHLHQKIGLVAALVAAITLAAITTA